jgi:hypothetical protein
LLEKNSVLKSVLKICTGESPSILEKGTETLGLHVINEFEFKKTKDDCKFKDGSQNPGCL